MAKTGSIEVCVVIILCCMSVPSGGFEENEEKKREILLGINGMNLGPQIIDVVSYSPHNHTWNTFIPNITDYSYSTWFLPSFFTAYCSITGIFYVLVDDVAQNKLVAVDVKRKNVTGTMKFDGRLKYQQCDETTGNLVGLLDTSGELNRKLVSIDFKGRKTTTLFASAHGYLPYYASTLDMSGKRFFFNTVIPHSEPPSYAVVAIDFKSQKREVSPVYTNYSIGGLLYEDSTKKIYGFLQTPPMGYEGPKYKALIGDMDAAAGTFEAVSDVWPGQGAYYDVGLTLDPKKRLMYTLLYDKLITLCLKSGKTLYVDEQERKGIGLHFARI